MKMQELYEVIGRVTGQEAELTPDTRFADDLGLDSLKVMELVAELEDHFDINLPLNLLPEIHTISDLATTIERLRGERDG